MCFSRAFFFGVLLLSALQGKGEFHIKGSYDLNSNGFPEALILNNHGVAAMLIETVSLSKKDTVWSYTPQQGITVSDVELLDINNDGYDDLILIPSLITHFKSKPWLYVFTGKKEGFSEEPVVYDLPLFESVTAYPTNLTAVFGEVPRLGVCYSSPVRQVIIFDIQLINDEIKINNSEVLSSPIFANGYGSLYISSLISDGEDLISVLSVEQNKIKTAVYNVRKNYKLIHKKTIDIEESESSLSLGFKPYKLKKYKKSGFLLPFRSGNVYLLYFENNDITLSKTDLSITKAFPVNDNDLSINAVLEMRERAIILENKEIPTIPNLNLSDTQQDRIVVPKISKNTKNITLNELSEEVKLNERKKSNTAFSTKADYSALSPTLGDFLNNVKKDLEVSSIQKEKTQVPEVNSDMKSVNWADEAGFLQMNLGEYVPEKTDTIDLQDPIPSLNLDIASFTSEAKIVLNKHNESLDTVIFNPGVKNIDLYYVLAMTSASDTKDRYVFDGEAPFGVAVNQIPLTGKATHFQHGISANLATLKLGETFDFAYSLRDAKSELDSITTLKMIHDMQTDVVLMSISPSKDSISQSYQPESFDPKLYEFPNYFFDGFPNSLDMDFTDKLIRFSFNGIEDSVYQGLYLSSTTPSLPPQSLAVFVDEGVLQAIRGEIVVRLNGSKKVTTEFDLIGSVKPSVMFSKLIQEQFSEELKEKLLQGASLEEPLFGPKGKLPKIIQEPRLPDVEPSQPEQEVPIELNRNNVLESNVKNDSLLINSSVFEEDNKTTIPETQKDGLIPSDLQNNIQQTDTTLIKDSLNLEKIKLEKRSNEPPSIQKTGELD